MSAHSCLRAAAQGKGARGAGPRGLSHLQSGLAGWLAGGRAGWQAKPLCSTCCWRRSGPRAPTRKAVEPGVRSRRRVQRAVVVHDVDDLQAEPLPDLVVVNVVACKAGRARPCWSPACQVQSRLATIVTPRCEVARTQAKSRARQQAAPPCPGKAGPRTSDYILPVHRHIHEHTNSTFEDPHRHHPHHTLTDPGLTRRDFESSGAKLAVNVLVGDNLDAPPARHGHHRLPTHQMLVPAEFVAVPGPWLSLKQIVTQAE